MLNTIFLLSNIILFSLSAQVSDNCFLAKENGKIVKQEGQYDKRHSPFSTFKIPLSIMGFEEGILHTPQNPLVEFTSEIKKSNEGSWYNPQLYPIHFFATRAQTPETWMRYSIVWYSKYITQKLGMQKFQHYVNQFDYGNRDISGTPQDGGVSWVRSSLQISPIEQLTFIEKLTQKSLPVSKQAQENTIEIMKQETIWDDWQLYGKTGGSTETGWFVGWIEKDSRLISFVKYVEQPKDSIISAGRTAKEAAKDNLISLMLQLSQVVDTPREE
jgi:beta-lactamase class D